MRRMPWAMYLWPGLPYVWSCGSWAGLAMAIGAAAILNVLLLITCGWTELIGSSLRISLWVAMGVAWVGAAIWSATRSPTGAAERESDRFAEAVDHYLRGDYYQTEQILEGLLRRNIRDVDARLMLATMWRRTGRPDEATHQLDVLARWEGAGKWELEIRKERELLAKAKTQHAATTEPDRIAAAGDETSTAVGHAA